MNANTPLTDAILEAALTRRAARARLAGLHDEIMAVVARTPQARRPLVARPAWLAWPAPSPRLIRALAVAGLLLALLAGMLVVGSRIIESWRRHPAALVPTGIETLAPEGSDFGNVVADPAGVVWAYGGGVLARLDPASGAVRTWTFGEDAAFGSIEAIVPARDGGVWLVPQAAVDQALRWFDGERFRDVVPAPPGTDVTAFAEAPDGSLWAGTDADVVRWDGTSWSAAAAGRPAARVSALAIDRSGAVWVGNDFLDSEAGTSRGLGISRFDGTRWETFPALTVGIGWVRSIEAAPDGSIWVATDGGLTRYDGHAWTDEGPASGIETVASAPDGTVWVTGTTGWGWMPGHFQVARYDGSAWVRYGSEDGLPTANCTQVAATSRGVYAGTGDGLYRLAGDRWERAWPQASVGPSFVRTFVGVSHDEAWALDDQGGSPGWVGTVWHYAGGGWSQDTAALPNRTYDLARAADGTLLAATFDGVAIRRDGQWTLLREGWAQVLALGRDGTAWFAGPADWTGLGDVRGFRLDDPTRVLPEIPDSPLSSVEHLAVGADGSIWAGQARSVEDPSTTAVFGLYRYRDGRWERVVVAALDGPDQRGVNGIAVAPNGDVWVAWQGAVDAEGNSGDGALTRYDGASWTAFGPADGLSDANAGLVVADDGTVWAGLAHFDGTRWTVVPDAGIGSVLDVARDGTVFVVGPSGLARFTYPGR